MPQKNKNFILESISQVFSTKKPKNKDSNKQQIRKRHWVLGSMLILGGSWITHTTTATIAC